MRGLNSVVGVNFTTVGKPNCLLVRGGKEVLTSHCNSFKDRLEPKDLGIRKTGLVRKRVVIGDRSRVVRLIQDNNPTYLTKMVIILMDNYVKDSKKEKEQVVLV